MEEAQGERWIDGGAWVPLAADVGGTGMRETALLLDSVGIPYVLQDSGIVFIPRDHAARARAELEAYVLEGRGWPPRPIPSPLRSDGVRGAGSYVTVLIAIHVVASFRFLGVDWLTSGRVDGERMAVDGEWFRAVTALSLHGDLTHLVSNLVFGCAFGLLAAHRLGAGWAWGATVMAGILGNILNVLALPELHRSIGASTGVFGTLGVLMAYEWSARGRTGEPWLRRFAPPVAGLVLFGWLGVGDSGGEGRVDVSAHAFGLIAGLAIGALLGKLNLSERSGPTGDRIAGAAALLTLAVGWIAALA